MGQNQSSVAVDPMDRLAALFERMSLGEDDVAPTTQSMGILSLPSLLGAGPQQVPGAPSGENLSVRSGGSDAGSIPKGTPQPSALHQSHEKSTQSIPTAPLTQHHPDPPITRPSTPPMASTSVAPTTPPNAPPTTPLGPDDSAQAPGPSSSSAPEGGSLTLPPHGERGSTHSSPLSEVPPSPTSPLTRSKSPETPPGPAGDWAPSSPSQSYLLLPPTSESAAPSEPAPSDPSPPSTSGPPAAASSGPPSYPTIPPLLSPTLPPTSVLSRPPHPAPTPAVMAAPRQPVAAHPQYVTAPLLNAQPSAQSIYEATLAAFVQFSRERPADWESIVGLYIQETKRNPKYLAGVDHRGGMILGGLAWQIDLVKLDKKEEDPGSIEYWGAPPYDVANITNNITEEHVPGFEEAVRVWAEATGRLEYVAKRAGWKSIYQHSPEWDVMHNIKKMDEGKERADLLAAAQESSPRFFAACMADQMCGYHTRKRKRPNYQDDTLCVYYPDGIQVVRVKTSPDPKRQAMMAGDGRPTQFHAVPLEERATDSKGNRLPWAHVWADDHPNASQNKKSRDPIETGPFGKRSARKGSSLRASRTTTPAKKENPTLDGFAQALEFDRRKAEAEAKEQLSSSTNKPQKEMSVASHNPPSMHKEPMPVMLYGYPANANYAAIDFYERASFGMICEDYERAPPGEGRRYPNTMSGRAPTHLRPLTAAERKMAMKYAGGEHWIKVTFDSAEAADRAIAASPHLIKGHWVYAQRFTGQGPERDEPIFERPEDREPGPLGARRPAHPLSQTLGRSSSISQQPMQQRASATLPRGFASSHATPQPEPEQAPTNNSPSSSTASSATATARVIATPRQRTTQTSDVATSASAPRRTFTHFPDIPRTYIHPPEEALLPVPTWSERMLRSLTTRGWIPGDIIGNVVPRLENGDFDWNNASFWWRFCFWFDGKFGTDLCGMRE